MIIFFTSKIEISRSKLQNNIEFLERTIAKNRKISVVVKGNAYGHGYESFIPLLCELGIDHFSVFSAQEAFELSKHIDDKRSVMIMGDTPYEALEWIIENGIEIFVFNTERLKNLIEVTKKSGKAARVHLEVETGMKRTGLEYKDLEAAIKMIKENLDCFELKGVCTHLAGAESITNYLRIKEQIKNFKNIMKLFESAELVPTFYHTACSAAAVRYPSTRMNLVRVGILTYGLWPSQEILIEHQKNKKVFTNPLKRIMKWKSSVMAIKEVSRGDYIGYGTTFQAPRDMRIAVIPVGYETGFSRSLSNKGSVLIDGQFAYLVGTVNMNAITVNITHIPDVKIGDEVVLIGSQGENEITVSAFSDLGEQLNYEMLTRLPSDIPREIVE
ncbi:MAG: alanine racemase [Bacteriovoracia bacterium]